MKLTTVVVHQLDDTDTILNAYDWTLGCMNSSLSLWMAVSEDSEPKES